MMAYLDHRDPRTHNRPKEGWPMSTRHVPASTSTSGIQLLDPRLQAYGAQPQTGLSMNTESHASKVLGIQGPNFPMPPRPPIPPGNLPPRLLSGSATMPTSTGQSASQFNQQQLNRSPHLSNFPIPSTLGSYPAPLVIPPSQSLMQRQFQNPLQLPPPPPVPPWFNPSHSVFPRMSQQHQLPRLTPPTPPPPSVGVHPTAVVLPPSSSPSPLMFPRPPVVPPFPPPHSHPYPTMAPSTVRGPRPVALRPWTPRSSTPLDLSQGLPGFRPAPAPVGLEEKMGLSEVKSQQDATGGDSGGSVIGEQNGSVWNRPSTEVSDPFITDWLKRVEISYLKHQREKSTLEQRSMKIPEARRLLSRSLELLSSLRSSHQFLTALPADNVALWNTTTLEQVNKCKEELLSIRMKFEVGDVTQHLSRKLMKRRDKRARKKRCVTERRARLSAQWEAADKATETWLQERRQEQLKIKTELSVQKAATGVLGDVKKKISDLQRFISLVKALKELRDIRREASRKKGDAPPIEADELFSETYQSLFEMLSQQAEVYDQEEHALRVLMAEEVEEKMTKEREREKASRRVLMEPRPLPHPLPHPPPSDPMAPFTQYYHQAESSVEAKASIRFDWDRFISSEGTAIPDDFDTPPFQPSSSQWANYLQRDTTKV